MKHVKILTVALLAVLAIAIPACQNQQKDPDAAPKKKRPFAWFRNILGNFSSQDTIFLDSNAVDKFLTQYEAFKPFSNDIRKFYRERKYAYAWFDGRGIIEQSSNLYNRVVQVSEDGVEKPLPYQDRFSELMDHPNRKASREELELMLTSEYLSLANLVWKGLDDAEIKKLGWYIPRKKLSYTAFLDSMLQDPSGDFLESEPLNPMYEALRKQLRVYRDIDSSGGWATIPAIKKAVKPGDSSSVIPAVRRRLVQLGDMKDSSGSGNIYDPSMTEAVVRYQARHGLANDGVIGKSMIDELNVPVRERIEQIVVNMERSRWLPKNLTSKPNYLLVNVPEYKLHVMENNQEAWNCNVVVGDTDNKTVLFTGVLNNIVFSPHWNVPESIVKDEIMPKMEEDPEYLEKQNLEITGERNGVPVVRQKPGTENSLGLVKFMFPNTHNIYLHDSPAKELFNRNARAFSHGCVRVGEPERLAAYLMRDMPDWDEGRINDAMHSGEEKYVNLKTKVPVFIVYFTAWVDSAGVLNFRKDIYNNDSRLARMILQNNEQATGPLRNPSSKI